MSEAIEEKKSLLRKIPGFRTGTKWKMLLAAWAYTIIITYILVTVLS